HGRNGAIGQHVIANRNFGINQMFDYPMIHSFVVPADDDDMRLPGKFGRNLLIKSPFLEAYRRSRICAASEA
ncbi:MAG: hypothetical protein QOF80_783, partial [Verrucomicrobiota bacterium]